jgi:hypothetical protein
MDASRILRANEADRTTTVRDLILIRDVAEYQRAG